MPWHMIHDGSEHVVQKAIPSSFADAIGPVVAVFDREGTVVESNAALLISRIADEETTTLAPAALVHWAARLG